MHIHNNNKQSLVTMTILVKNLLIILLHTCLCTGSNAKPAHLVTRLIHRDSVHSPHYKPNESIFSRTKRMLETSHARYAYMAAKAKATTTIDAIADPVGPDPSTLSYMLNVSIGTPPVTQIVNFDTTTSLTWVQCLPCGGERCDKQRGEIFDPAKSSTYRNLLCTSAECSIAPEHSCEKDTSNCQYRQTHYSGPSSVGILSNDTFVFKGMLGEEIVLNNVTFGCGHLNDDHNPVTSGLLGLGGGKFSIVSQSNNAQFSYCLRGIENPEEYSSLIIGDAALYAFTGRGLPLAVKNGMYYLPLARQIYLGDLKLYFDSNLLETSASGDTGVVIDTASSFTYLPRQVVDAISGALQTMFENKMEKVSVPENPNYLCYNARVSNGDFIGYTPLSFAGMDIEMSDLFFPYKEGISCMGFLEAPSRLSVIGALAQRHCNVGFNLAKGEIHLKMGICVIN